MKPRIVILGGAGAMGRISTLDLLRTCGNKVHVVIADRDVSAVRGLPVETAQVDVTDPGSLRKVLSGAYATIASLPYRFNLDAMHGALDAGAHYIDLGGLFHVTRQQLELASAFKRRGVMAILGIGSAPGIVNVLAVMASRGLDQVREIHCVVGNIDRTRFRNASPLGFGYSADTLLDEFTMPSAVFREGKFKMVPALDPGERMAVQFPVPVGTLGVDTTLHSEVATLPLSFRKRGIREVTFRQAFEKDFREKLMFLAQLGLTETCALPSANGHGIVPRDVLMALVRRFAPPVQMGKAVRYEVLRTVVRGTVGRRRVTVTADCHADNQAGHGIGPDIDTGAPPSIAVQLMLAGEMKVRPGVWAPEQVVPVAPFVRELRQRGMIVTCGTA
ncbi:MAG TPA: saccharopine dehydrogenase C-terminal domain-containing protein [Vicinamibacterales bacterium]|jgi:saccharopine dehydrogenase (NAD+, L-lysine-forming)|nr:saccharopine dehydrogenase C-terminal domain-containing protein [Vicinamibacterales bacterium]